MKGSITITPFARSQLTTAQCMMLVILAMLHWGSKGTQEVSASQRRIAQMLFENGVDIVTARYLMGHADIQTTLRIYAHFTENMKETDFAKAVKIG